jgi:hypothetical protein
MHSKDPYVHRMMELAKATNARMMARDTAPTPTSEASAASGTLNNYLKYAATKPYAILGSVTGGAGVSGGSSANVIWQQYIPIVPAFCVAIDLEITLPVALTLPATTGTATLSPFAPYSALSQQLTLAGAPPWPLTELTPWHIDETMHKINYDPYYPGLGGLEGIFGTNSILDQGPSAQSMGLAPGATVTNTTGSPVTTDYLFQFNVRIQLQRKRHLLWGAVPFGDPENRPYHTMQINQLIGTNPETALFVNASGAATCIVGYTAVPNATVNCIYQLSYIDLLPDGSQTAPKPSVNYGLQMAPSTTTGLAAGSIMPITHRTAMIYTAIHHILVNGGIGLRPDYMGLWDDQDQQSARWSYDSQNNTKGNWWTEYHRKYRRYPYTGVFSVELDDGVFPEIPSVTPYDGLISPDQTYAETFGVPVTPAVTTALRIATGVTLSSAYVRNYEIGLVKVPY